MGKVEKSIEIRAPPEKVWELLAFDRIPEWVEDYKHHVRVEYTSEVNKSEDKYQVGATARGIPKKQGDDYCRFEMKESQEHEKMGFRAMEETKYFGTLSVFNTYLLEPVGTDTKFTYEVESEKLFGIIGGFLERLYFRRWEEKQMEKSLENLKKILEK